MIRALEGQTLFTGFDSRYCGLVLITASFSCEFTDAAPRAGDRIGTTPVEIRLFDLAQACSCGTQAIDVLAVTHCASCDKRGMNDGTHVDSYE
jgi:hypothetical protein